jgi:hypothetical protein
MMIDFAAARGKYLNLSEFSKISIFISATTTLFFFGGSTTNFRIIYYYINT